MPALHKVLRSMTLGLVAAICAGYTWEELRQRDDGGGESSYPALSAAADAIDTAPPTPLDDDRVLVA